jgi:hypothetical protein
VPTELAGYVAFVVVIVAIALALLVLDPPEK